MTRAARSLRFSPRTKVWLEVDGEYAFGLGACEILEAIEKTGSIKEAAASLGKSYRHVWGRLKEAEAALGESLVETRVGGERDQRSRLTPRAGRLIRAYRALRQKLFAFAAREFDRQFARLDSASDT